MPEVIHAPHLTGPFDIIGDVHGCYEELVELLYALGYQLVETAYNYKNFGLKIICPANRKLVFAGDLVDRGPDTPAVLQLIMSAAADRNAHAVMGNHDDKLMRKLAGRRVEVKNGLEQSLEQLKTQTPKFKEMTRNFLESLPYYLVLDDEKLVVAHGGLPEKYQFKSGKSVRAVCLYGPATGIPDAFGLPVRLNWAQDYAGKPLVVYGHTPVPEPVIHNNTINIDTGCVFGGRLTALQYPELKTVSVPAKKQYAVPRRPFI